MLEIGRAAGGVAGATFTAVSGVVMAFASCAVLSEACVPAFVK
jgi:hypothetical protein